MPRHCSGLRRSLHRRLPPLSWLQGYTASDTVADCLAGVTVGLTLLPQAIAYASLAGLEPQYGLYSSFAGGLVYMAVGTVPQVSIGPTAIVSLLTLHYTQGTSPDLVVLLCFVSGLVQLLLALLQLGVVVEYVSVPVTAGFTSAAALTIATSQVKALLGLRIKPEGFIDTWTLVVNHVSETRLLDCGLSIGCCTFLLLLRALKDSKLGGKVLNKATWLVSIGRNALVVVICAGLSYSLATNGHYPFTLTGNITSGLPAFSSPPFQTVVDGRVLGLWQMLQHLGSGCIVVPLVSLLGNIAIAKSFSQGQVMDASQEMVALGLCNVVGSFLRSMPVSGAFSRSAVSHASGVRSPLSGLYSALLVVLALGFLTPYFYFIPKATLASVIVCAVLFMVEIRLVRTMWTTNKKDLLPAVGTFAACLWLGVEVGIVVGVVMDLVFLLHINARPSCAVRTIMSDSHGPCTVVRPRTGLLYPAVGHLRAVIAKAAGRAQGPIVLDCSHISHLDFTALQGFQSLIEDFKKTSRHLVFHRLSPGPAKLMASAGAQLVTSQDDIQLFQVLKGLSSPWEAAVSGGTKPEVGDFSGKFLLEDLKTHF